MTRRSKQGRTSPASDTITIPRAEWDALRGDIERLRALNDQIADSLRGTGTSPQQATPPRLRIVATDIAARESTVVQRQSPRVPTGSAYEQLAWLTADRAWEAYREHHRRYALTNEERDAILARTLRRTDASAIFDGVAEQTEIVRRRTPPGPPEPSYVYFAEIDGHLKIGVSKNAGKRMKTLRGGKVGSVELLAFAFGTVDDERRLHASLRRHRFRNEYFHDVPCVRRVIRFVRDNDRLPTDAELADSLS